MNPSLFAHLPVSMLAVLFTAALQAVPVRAAISDYTWLTLAGPDNVLATFDGIGPEARIHRPTGIATDAGGNVYVAQVYDHVIRKVSPSGEVTTLAGKANQSGGADGKGAAARFNGPHGLAVDRDGRIYVADFHNHAIRSISPAGEVTTLAGVAGYAGYADGQGNMARLSGPTAVALDAAGNVWFGEDGNRVVRKLTPAGQVITIAGRPGYQGSADGHGNLAQFGRPVGLAFDQQGYLYVADQYNHAIRKVTPQGYVTTLAGKSGTEGNQDGSGSAARFSHPFGLTIGSDGNLYVAPVHNHCLRRVTLAGVVSTFVGATNGAVGSADGTGDRARFWMPHAVAADLQGNLYVADHINNALRRITPQAVVTSIAGVTNMYGAVDGTGASARFWNPNSCRVDRSGNVFVSDHNNCAIRKITPSGQVTTAAGLLGTGGERDGQGAAARFYYPAGLAFDSKGDLYVADYWGYTIRRMTPSGFVTTVAGRPSNPGSDDGPPASARFRGPAWLAFDRAGNLWISDAEGQTVRRMDTNRNVVTVAGQPGVSGSADGPAAAATFNLPRGLAVDEAGNVYVADRRNHTIRKIGTNGIVSTIAGTVGAWGSVDGVGAAARFHEPDDLILDPSGNLIVCGVYNGAIRSITPSGEVSTLAGQFGVWWGGEGTGGEASFNQPQGVDLDAQGNLYVADWGAQCIRRSYPVCPDRPTIDQTVGLVGAQRQFGTSPRTASSWSWSLIRRPSGSRAQLSSFTTRNPTFTPDVADVYVFRLQATTDSGAVSLHNVELRALTGPRGGTVSWEAPALSGAESAGTVTLNIRRRGAIENPTTVRYHTSAQTALASADFLPASGTVSFASEETSKSVVVSLVRDFLYELPEAFSVWLNDATPGWALAAPEATVTIIDNDVAQPVILSQPTNRVALPGGTAAFSVSVSGAEPLRYQWMKGTTALFRQTNAVLVLAGVQPIDSGQYWVTITNSLGSISSDPATLKVISPFSLEMRQAGNVLNLEVSGFSAALELVLEESADLAAWRPVRTNTVAAGGAASFQVPVAAQSKAFYRVKAE